MSLCTGKIILSHYHEECLISTHSIADGTDYRKGSNNAMYGDLLRLRMLHDHDVYLSHSAVSSTGSVGVIMVDWHIPRNILGSESIYPEIWYN
jgi:hypothetical protein